MAKRATYVLCLLLGVLAAWSCGEDPGEDTVPTFKSLSPEGTEWILGKMGTVDIPFSVRDADFAFNYTVGSESCQVSLLLQGGGTPEFFTLDEIRKEGPEGGYIASVRDLGTEDMYSEDVRLAMKVHPGTPKESIILSSPFRIVSESAKSGRVILRTGLPVVYLETEGPVLSKEDYVGGTLSITGSDKEDENVEGLACSVRGRGNTTWYWPKKPYLIKLDEKAPILGMPKHKRWILLANFLDRTMMRNLVSMKVASMTSLEWTPRCRSVELVMGGKHLGNYLLIEQVRVDKNRVDITEMKKEDGSGEALTGGYLLELDFHYDNPVQWKDPHGESAQWVAGSNRGIPFGIKSPDEEDVTPAQISYIKNYVHEAAEALYGEDFKDPEKGYAKYLDVDSFVDYWIVFEVMGNHELGNPGSVYMHKDRGGKLTAGPVWDFDWGVLSYETSPQARTGLVNRHAIWYSRLFEDPAFEARVEARFKELLPQLATIPRYMEDSRKTLSKSAQVNFSMWNPADDASQNGGRIINGDENMSFDAAVDRLIDIYTRRLEVIGDCLSR